MMKHALVVALAAVLYASWATVAGGGDDLLRNGSFEKGAPGQAPPGWVEWNRNPSTVMIAAGGREGSQCAKVTLVKSEECGFVLADQRITHRLAAGQRYRARCFVRADEPVRVTLWLYGGTRGEGDSPGIELAARADAIAFDNWSPVAATLEIPELATGSDPYLRVAVALDRVDGAAMYVDDVELTLVPESARSSAHANLLGNGDFEQGAVDDGPPAWAVWFRNPSTFATGEGGRKGSRCARLKLVKNEKCSFVLADQWIYLPLAKGERYRARCFVKADAPVRLALYLYGGTMRQGRSPGIALSARADATVGTDWAPVSAELDIPELATGKEPYLRFALGLGAAGPTVYVDDAEITRIRSGLSRPRGDHVFGADRYEIGYDLPLDVWHGPVGSSGTITFKLPADFVPQRCPLALLWLSVDDIDAPMETSIHVNGQGPIVPTQGLVGEGKGHEGRVTVSPVFLKPGVNRIRFVFEDDLNGTTKGFSILEARLTLVRPGPALPSWQFERVRNKTVIDEPRAGTIVALNVAPDRIRMCRHDELNWKKHPIRKGDGKGGWTLIEGEHRFLPGLQESHVYPFGLAQMDNGEVILAASVEKDGRKMAVMAWSKDAGDTWTDWYPVKRASGRPMMLTYLGTGRLSFATLGYRYFSEDYGRTWPKRVAIQPAANGGGVFSEGNTLVDRDAEGNAIAIAETVCNFGPTGTAWAHEKPTWTFFRWSTDDGRTWHDEIAPKVWHREVAYGGKTYVRGVSEGGLVRAANGWVVAALRTDMPPRYFGKPANDSLEGVGVSISKDDGRTWSELNVLYDAGRHHANLRRLPDGRLLMALIVRVDVEDGRLATCRRGCEAVISSDHGVSWNVAGKYILDEYKYHDADEWFNGKCGHLDTVVLDDGRILTAYGNYLARAAALIRWRP